MKNQNGDDRGYVLDSSAFLTFFEDEKGADAVQELLESERTTRFVPAQCVAILENSLER